MNWKITAAIQRCCAALPFGGEAIHYAMQRSAGGLRHGINLHTYFVTAAEVVKQLRSLDVQMDGARVMEIGTGQALGAPIAFYLCGAETIHTFDLRRHLKPSLVMESLQRSLRKLSEIQNIFFPLTEGRKLESRLKRLTAVSNLQELMSVAHIHYRAPADATATGLPDRSIDIQFSNNVFEHVPGETLQRMLIEGSRVLSERGIAYHIINPADHFARNDRRITTINFLQFSESQWKKLAGNQFAYHSRLRASEYRRIYRDAGHEILAWRETEDLAALELLKSGFALHSDFHDSLEQLSIMKIEALSRPDRNGIES